MSVRNAQDESVDQGLTKVPDVPDTPTIGTATNVGTNRAYNIIIMAPLLLLLLQHLLVD